jgi:hypothetical protein
VCLYHSPNRHFSSPSLFQRRQSILSTICNIESIPNTNASHFRFAGYIEMEYPYSIQTHLEDNNYQEQCTLCCCITLYVFNCGVKLGYYQNDTYYALPLWCGIYNCK